MTVESLPPYSPEQGSPYSHFLRGLEEAAENLKSREPVMSRFFATTHELAATVPEIANAVEAYAEVESGQGNPTSYAVNKMFKAAQRVMLDGGRRYTYDYPASFARSNRWRHVLPVMFLGEGSEEQAKFTEALTWHDRKNRYERSKVAVFAATMLLGRTNVYDGHVYHEYGSAGGLNAKAWAAAEMGRAVMYNLRPGRRPTRNDDATAAVYVGTRTAQFREGYCVEIQPPLRPYDPNTMDVFLKDIDDLKAFSLTPKELDGSRLNGDERDRNVEETFDRFALMQPEKPITTLRDDITNPSPETHATLSANKADVVFMSHVPSQILTEFDDTIQNIYTNYLAPRGIIVVNEYANVRDGKLVVHENWTAEWAVTTAVLEGARPEAGFIPFMRWRTSHCTEGSIIKGAMSKFTSTKPYLR